MISRDQLFAAVIYLEAVKATLEDMKLPTLAKQSTEFLQLFVAAVKHLDEQQNQQINALQTQLKQAREGKKDTVVRDFRPIPRNPVDSDTTPKNEA